MAVINGVELWFVRCNPARPNSMFDKENPTWEVQLRTFSKELKKQMEALKLNVKAIVPDDGAPYFKVQLKKGSFKKDGTAADPVKVVGGDLKPIDPDTVGNGSVGNIRIWQYEYPAREGTGMRTASMLMAIQVTKLVKFERKARGDDDFGEQEMEIVEPPEGSEKATF